MEALPYEGTNIRNCFLSHVSFEKRIFKFRKVISCVYPTLWGVSDMHPRYVAYEGCFIFICLYLIFSRQAFFDLRLLANRIDLVLSSPKYILSLLSTNKPHIFSKSLLSRFSVSSTSLCWYKMHESSAYKSTVDLTACGLSFIKIKKKMGHKIDPCGTTQEFCSKSESLLSVFARKIRSERQNLSHCIVQIKNIIDLSFFSKVLWSIVSKTFWRLTEIILVNKPSSNVFKILSIKKTNID